jgi:hypothetical protein
MLQQEFSVKRYNRIPLLQKSGYYFYQPDTDRIRKKSGKIFFSIMWIFLAKTGKVHP